MLACVQVVRTEECFGEYVKSLESYDQELKKLTEEKSILTQEVTTLRKDRTTKFKLLGATLMISQHLSKWQEYSKIKLSFQQWKYQTHVSQVSTRPRLNLLGCGICLQQDAGAEFQARK